MRSSSSRVSTLCISMTSMTIALLMVRRVLKQRVYALASIVETRTTPPKLNKKEHYTGFGGIKGPNRGENPMEIPVYLKDPYYWVRDDSRKDKEIISHLEEENKYTNFRTQHLKELQESIYEELLSHVQETDSAYPHPHGSFEYYARTEKGKSYQIHCRKPSNSCGADEEDSSEEVFLDENILAEGFKHFDLYSAQPSPDHSLVAYSVDTKGYETYTGYIKDLKTGKLLEDKLEDISGSIVWGKDQSTIYYATMDEAHRSNKVWKHKLGTDRSQDVLLYEENDEIFDAFFDKTSSGKYLLIGSGSSETDEMHVLSLEHESATPQMVEPRQKGVLYSIDHHENHFYIVTNRDKATNFKLMRAEVTKLGGAYWEEFIPYNSNIKTDSIACFKNHMAIFGREDGLSQIWVMRMDGSRHFHRLEFDEASYTVDSATNMEYDTQKLRFTYSSPVTPDTIYDLDMDTKEKLFLKQRPCPNYDASLYATERIEAASLDGTIVPMSAVYRKDKLVTGPRPVHLYGYGSYEACMDPQFQSTILPLLDRGVTYVIAHIRGGGEMGRSWYEDAKYKTKKKTFEDFVACAEHLVQTQYTKPSLLTCEGRSAGGLLIGAVLNMRPHLFQAAVAGVPFVDVMSSMCDSTIPLTTGEWEEWGNPNEDEFFSYMLSYSPYENVIPQDYPNILVTSGLFDPRVAYWEPTKWVARLRETKTDSNDILLKMDLSSGHFSASDRYHYLREKAFDISYLLDQLNLK